ncbi:unnamed protein product [Penicillium salamii]|uniref:Sigma-70 region 2 family protein n=1 Tax=Penicillium salamii TaxID=1612424 RepID=A0A9W4N5X7_9EURO|nr:unnamed protein product [Penicillium salamii]CAG8296064.1 unnamed protein product [Penicillium salamii]CAG8402556.1 unnamed protein product [Penicillium salamii]
MLNLMADSSGSNSSAPVRWQFIDSSNNSRSNLTQAKRHVMQEYMRQKKGGSKQSDSDEERPQPKRGRPRKTRAKRTGKKAKSDSDSNERNNQQKSTKDVISSEEPADEEIVRDILGSASNTQFSEASDGALFLPYRPSPDSDAFFPPDSDSYFSGTHHTQSDALDFNDFLWSSAATTPSLLTQSPKSIMSAARTDPFNTLPIELDLDGQRLFDFYVNTMPACSYGSHFRTPKAHNWYTAVFVPEGMKGAVAFQNTIIVHAANTWSWVRNEGQTPNTLLHRDRAVTMLREHISNNPQDISDVAIISCLSAAALEDFDPRPGRKEISWIHMRAAREMIRARGGPAAFANTRLGMLINWQDYILSGYETNGPSFFYEYEQPTLLEDVSNQPSSYFHSMPSPPYSTSSTHSVSPCPETRTIPPSISPVEEIRLQCEEFLDFLRRCEQLALYQRDNPDSLHIARQSIIQPTCLLHEILAAPPGARFSTSGDRKQMVARLAALMILNAAIWDYRYTPARAGLFLATLEKAMIDSEVGMSGSVEAILQILLECNDGNIEEWPSGFYDISSSLGEDVPDYSQYSPTSTSPSARPWFAGRMLKIAKRLRSETWYRVSEFLFSCLTLQVQESSMVFWEAELRQEILDAPLTSYHMRSLIE